MNEYQEILAHYYSASLANYVIDAILNARHAEPISVYFKWNLITADPDDNKFVDCALNANADYIVTNDKHFNVLKEIDFPPVKVVDIVAFREMLGVGD